jgi:hypothetical protein
MESLNEKAKSKTQQRLMGMVHAYQKGDLELNNLPAGLVKKIKDISDGHKKKTGDKRKKTKGMSNKDVKDFASTKHKGLPEKVKENLITKFDKFIKLNESDIENEDVQRVVNEWEEKWKDNASGLAQEFIEMFPTSSDFDETMKDAYEYEDEGDEYEWNGDDEAYLIAHRLGIVIGGEIGKEGNHGIVNVTTDDWCNFFNELIKAGW